MPCPTPASPASHATGGSVFDVLSSSHARLHRRAAVGDGLVIAQWSNSFDSTKYQPEHHTLSLYLSGGQGTYRADAPGERGAPGKLCLMPAGHAVDWIVGPEQHFVHLYFAADQLGPLALRVLDREARELALPELNFVDDPALAATLRGLVGLDWEDAGDRLAANQIGHDALVHVLARHAGRALGRRLRGGLAPATRRRLAEYIDAHLAEDLSVGRLAASCALSEHHFAHMFRASFGCPPHAWIVARRLERAAAVLRARPTAPLEDVAVETGHASASHLVRRFKARWGVTPGQYRTLAR